MTAADVKPTVLYIFYILATAFKKVEGVVFALVTKLHFVTQLLLKLSFSCASTDAPPGHS